MYERKKLTQLVVDRVHPPKGGRLEIADTLVPGLVLRVTARGAKSFNVFWKVRDGEGGKKRTQRRKTLGFMSLEDARDRARKMLEDVDHGRSDPRPLTVKDIGDQYIAAERQHLSEKTIYEIEKTFANHVYPEWERRMLREIEPADLTLLLDKKIAAGRVGTAREVRKYVSGLYRWAIERGYAERNPVATLGKKSRQRLAYPTDSGRALEDKELKALWSAAGEMGYPYGPFYQLLMLTGQRPYEWRDAREREIADNVLTVPKERFKTRRQSHRVPLAPEARKIISGLQRKGCCDWLFQKRGECGPINGQSKRDADLAEAAKVENFTVYDLRKTCATRLAELGVDPFIIDQVQSRSQLTPLQRTYIKHDFEEEKRAALQKYARHILKVVRA